MAFEKFESDNAKSTDNDWAAQAAAQAYERPQPGAQQNVQEAAVCVGRFTAAPGEDAFKLSPPQIGINGGLAVFNLPCDHEKIQKLKNFVPNA